MLRRRVDPYLNQMYSHDTSVKEAVKQKMLNQECIFKQQVRELHRLYQIQMILMKNSQLKEVSTTQSASCSFQEILRRPTDAVSSASHYVKHSGHHFLKKGDGWGTAENPVQVEHYFDGETESSSDEVKLYLNIGGDTMQKRSRRKICDEKPTFTSSQCIIDLEDSTHVVLSRDTESKSALGCAACSAYSGNLCVFQSHCSCTTGVKKHPVNGRSQLIGDGNKNCLEQNSLNQGVKEWLENLPGTDLSSATKVFSSPEIAYIDLNKPPLDESPSLPKDLEIESSVGPTSGVSEKAIDEYHVGSSPVGISCIKPENKCVSAVVQEDTLDITVMASNSTGSSTIMTGSKSRSVDLDSCLRSPSDHSEVHGCLTGNSQHKDAQFVSDLPRRNHKGKTMIEVNDKRAEGNTTPPHPCSSGDIVEDIDNSPASCKSDCVATNPTSSLKTVQSGINLEKSDLSRMNSFHNPESSQDESSIRHESRSGSFGEKTEGSALDDALIQKGAVSLVYFLLEVSSKEGDCIPDSEVDKMNLIANGKRDQPECSHDSFESMVLKLQESNEEDYCVSSMPVEVNDQDKKDYGIKLRRGRRLKDFQKDILPGMASLARHEICEDIRIMEGVIRSREYKRLRKSKMSSAQKWFTPVRSRRSRLNYTGRKYY